MEKIMALKPRVSEKAYALSQSMNVYVMQVPASANKLEIANAIAAQFAVTVTNVNLVNVKGKLKRTIKKGGRQTYGKRSDMKKAYITLKAGETLPIFASEEDKKPAAKSKTAKKEKK